LVVPLIPKIIETARAIFGLSAEDYEALFTETVWTTTRCILYCHVGANGKFNAAGWSSVKSDLKIQLGSGATQAGSNLAAMVDVWALTGLNHAAAFGAGSEGNCDDCPCSTCDWSMWEQWVNGVILSQDHSHITIQAVLVSGSWNAGVRNVNIHACCCQVVYGIPEGQHINTSGYIPCDETNDDQTNMSFTYESQSANAFVFQSDTPFTITLTGQALEDCV
jgi:hypothetical protein